jgi:hypothetical protein
MIPDTALITIPATAGDVNFSYINDTGRMMKLAYTHLLVTTDATVANRYPEVWILDADGALVMDSHAGAPVVASLSNRHIEFMQGIYRETAFINGTLQVPIAIDLLLIPGWELRFRLNGGVAGDSYSGRATLLGV